PKEVLQVSEQERNIANAVQREGEEPAIAVERRSNDVSVAREYRNRRDVLARQRTAQIPVREDQQRETRGRIRPQRRVGATLHMRHRFTGRQRIVDSRIVGRSGITDQHHVGNGLSCERTVYVGVIGRVHSYGQRVGGIGQQIGGVTAAAVVARNPF